MTYIICLRMIIKLQSLYLSGHDFERSKLSRVIDGIKLNKTYILNFPMLMQKYRSGDRGIN